MVNLEVPINSVSFGQVACNILYELQTELNSLNVFPIGKNIDFSATSYSREYQESIINSIKDRLINYSSKDNSFKLWHINGAESKIGDDQSLITFHETDSLTKTEVNILNNQKNVYVTSQYTKQVFESCGVNNVIYWPLWFDSFHFKNIELRKKQNINFGLFGKLEKRKAHLKTIKTWIKAFGGDKRYRLNCCINNPHLMKIPAGLDPAEIKIKSTEATRRFVQESLEDLELPWNVNFLHSESRNVDYNRILNNTDIVLGMSHCEGFDLPLFQCLCLGKKAVVFDSHVHKDYCDESNSVLIPNNNKKIDAHDGLFFVKGQEFNQGQWEDWDEDDLIQGIKKCLDTEFKGRNLIEEFKFNNIFV